MILCKLNIVWSHRDKEKENDKYRCTCSGWDFMTRAQEGVMDERIWRETYEFAIYRIIKAENG